MTTAHGGLLPGGPGTTLLVVAVVLFGMGVYLFATKGPPRTVLVLVLVSIAIGIGAVAIPDEHDAHVSITAPHDGATVPAGDDIQVRLAVTSLGSGHVHLSVDGVVVSMSSSLSTSITLEPGPHTIEAELVSAAHRPLSPRVIDSAEVTATPPA